GSGALERLRIASDHHSELTILGAGLSSGDRGVETAKATRPCCSVEFTRDDGRGSRIVDEDRAFLHAFKRARGADCDGPQIVIVTDAGEYEVRTFGSGAGCRGRSASILRN